MELNEKIKEDISFDEEEHVYKYKGVTLKSVTTLLDEYKEEFNLEMMSQRIADKTGKTQQEVKDEWQEKGDYSSKLGNAVHKFCENLLKGEKISKPLDKKEKSIRSFFFQYLDDHKQLLPIGSELKVILPSMRIAGTIDLIMRSKENGKVFLYDFKTSKEITNKSYNKKLSYPIDYLDDCNFVHYSLQLSLYKYILKKRYNIDIDGCYIIHLTPFGYKEFKCNDYTNEVEVLLIHNLLNTNK